MAAKNKVREKKALKLFCNLINYFWYNRNLSLLLFFIYLGLIFILSSIPIKIPYYFFFDPRKLIFHFMEYSILGILSFLSIRRRNTSIAFSIAYGITDEIHQYFVPGRFFDIYDMFSDSIGSVFGVVLVLFVLNKCDRRNLLKM
ncbi:MAG: VanZ family protein [Candidatus Aenigmarchaeota archaeon]|nr:VanZ family protein [Candidatus Aenigmarchaeota archaeon]